MLKHLELLVKAIKIVKKGCKHSKKMCLPCFASKI